MELEGPAGHRIFVLEFVDGNDPAQGIQYFGAVLDLLEDWSTQIDSQICTQ